MPSGTAFDFGALSPDRSRVLTSHLESEASANAKSIQLWDAKTGRRLGKPLQSTSPFNCAAFSDDNRLVVAASEDGTVYLLDARTGALAGRPLKHGRNVLYAVFSPDGALLATCGMDQSARLWVTQTGQPVGERLRHEAPVTLAAFSPDSKTVATASMDGVVRVWDERGAPRGMLNKCGHVEGLLFHPSRLLLVVSTGDEMRLWDVASQQDVVSAMAGRSDKRGFSLVFSPHTKTAGMFVINREFDLPSDDRPAGDLVGLSQLYSGWRLDAKANAVPLDKNERQALWRRLYAKYPEEFTVSAQAAVDWRIEQLQSASERPAAIAFHRRWLAAELAEAGWQPEERGNEGGEQDNYLQRLYALALYGSHAAATAAADALAQRWPKDSDTQYNCARVHALAAGAVKGDNALADRYAARAVALLRQAVKAGYKDNENVRKDADLETLRRREDFQTLQKEIAGTR